MDQTVFGISFVKGNISLYFCDISSVVAFL